MTNGTQSQLIPIVVGLLVVARFLMRELRPRRLRLATLWIRPVVVVVLTLLLIGATVSLGTRVITPLAAALAIGVAVGVVVGRLVLRSTRVEPVLDRARVLVHGSRETAAIWIGALIVRLGIRWFVHGGSPALELAINCGTVASLAAAFVVFALGVRSRAAELHAPT